MTDPHEGDRTDIFTVTRFRVSGALAIEKGGNAVGTGPDRDYALVERCMNVTAKLMDVQAVVERALEEAREFAGQLEQVAMQKRREQRTQAHDR
jgi:predicted ATP-grasp superfamily ATP-dependent carboligase